MTRLFGPGLVLLLGFSASLLQAEDQVAKDFAGLAGRIQVLDVGFKFFNPRFDPGSRNANEDKEFDHAKALTQQASPEQLKALLSDPSPMVRTIAAADLLDTKHLYNPPNGVELPDMASQAEIDFWSLARSAAVPPLEALLKHPDPKVRTLALLALYEKEDAHVLPAIVALADDPAPTFLPPGDLPQSGAAGPPQPQTVGAIATGMVQIYLEAAGYSYGIKGVSGQPGFADYWDKRKDRNYCASWFAVQAYGIRRGYRFPISNGESDALRFQHRFDALPPDDRAWNLLEVGLGFTLASDEELVQILQGVGPDKLLLYLSGHPPTDDPDLQSGSDTNRAEAVSFLLRHADELFRPQDADAILAQARSGIGGERPDWWIAAAHLQPQKADVIFREGYEAMKKSKAESQNFPPLIISLWKMMGEKETNLVTDWFYLPDMEANAWSYAESREDFIGSLAKDPRELNKNLLAHILQDARARTLKPEVLAPMAQTINGWLGLPVVLPDEISRLRGQMGKGGTRAPEMVPGILQRLRRSIPQWNS